MRKEHICLPLGGKEQMHFLRVIVIYAPWAWSFDKINAMLHPVLELQPVSYIQRLTSTSYGPAHGTCDRANLG